MPQIDLNLIGKTSGPVIVDYTWQEAALYALAVGAGPEELSLIYEGNADGMKVLPGFVVVPSFRAFPDLGEINWPLMIHGQQHIKMHKPLPPSARLVLNGKVVNIYDKRKAALLEIVVSGSLENGGALFDAQWSLFYMGAGGFGGDKGPKSAIYDPPDAAPDFETTYDIPTNQAALYRLLGDLNPLHIDPHAAAMAGFERPILHGLCTYGYATRALVNANLEGDPDRLVDFSARFAKPVYPGDKLTVRGWRDGDHVLLEAGTEGGTVLKNGLAVLA